ncbi:MAG: hypothetical protein KGY70_12765 [Bacteroidales bacterium]|nr:hypothetical protein [Bacteroidales bacterium]MBS3776057.1 hypothetical protein [Bacteroidales bacterium]
MLNFACIIHKRIPLVSGKVCECGMVCGVDEGPPALASVAYAKASATACGQARLREASAEQGNPALEKPAFCKKMKQKARFFNSVRIIFE